MKGSIIKYRILASSRLKYLLGIFLLCLFLPLLSQNNSPARQQLEREISLTEALLEASKDKEQKALGNLKLLNRQIALRSRLISKTQSDILREKEKIEELKGITTQLEKDVQDLSVAYSRLAQLTQRSYAAQNFWLMILSSESFSEAYYRLIYFRQFTRYRKRQIEAIGTTKTYLQEKYRQLLTSIEKNEKLIKIKREENQKLDQSKGAQKKTFAILQQQSTSISRRLEKRKRKLKNIIREDQNTYLLEAKNVDDSYAENFRKRKGLLPWPIPPQEVVITEHFGESEDEFGNRIFNDGIYLATSQGQPVKAVYSGKVTAVTRLPMSGAVVILEHGKYRTVYANLVNTYVKKGDLVSENQVLGMVRQDPRSGESSFNFLIYLIPDKFLNPEEWLLEN